jgi:hypothetical protein
MDTDRRKDEQQWEHAFDFFSEEHTIHGTNDTLPTDDTSTPTTTTTTTTTATLQKYNITLTKKFDHEPAKSAPATTPAPTATPAPAPASAPATTEGTDTAFGDDGISSGDQDDDGLFETRVSWVICYRLALITTTTAHRLPLWAAAVAAVAAADSLVEVEQQPLQRRHLHLPHSHPRLTLLPLL